MAGGDVVAGLVDPPAVPPLPGIPDSPCPAPMMATAEDLDVVAQTAQILAPVHRLATGQGVRVVVIDTGIGPNPRLARVTPGTDFTASGDSLVDCDGHGTIVAGIIAASPNPVGDIPAAQSPPGVGDGLVGVAPDAELISVKQSTNFGTKEDSGDLMTLTLALREAVALEPHIITMSIASCVDRGMLPALAASPLGDIVRDAEERGIVIVASAGNAGPQCQPGMAVVPAELPGVLAVGARRTSLTMESYSMPNGDRAILPPDHAFGEDSTAPLFPGLSAPGTIAVGLNPHGPGLVTGMRGKDGPAPITGTSFAAPFVAGVVALLLERHPGLTPGRVRHIVADSADPITGAVDPIRVLSHAATSTEADILPPEKQAVHYTGPLAAGPNPSDPTRRPLTMVLRDNQQALGSTGTTPPRLVATADDHRENLHLLVVVTALSLGSFAALMVGSLRRWWHGRSSIACEAEPRT
ncbi:S8 family serine peptidase [Corynebacterium sp. 13CS0277]|uniref:S8 family serine peptidase n=1 Tax=Corynebacterium sp. 13CS0277 TaxID=2071994 RepID=UPI001304E9E2|nr:S8 family serine peptidase [Corynebacterium sp. 13CS0277]